MPLVYAKCPECGGVQAVDDRKIAVACQYCAELMFLEEGIELLKKDNYWLANNENI